VDPNVLYEVISNSAGSSWMFQNRVPHILAGDYTPLSAVNIFVKDLGIVLDSAKKATFPLPLTATRASDVSDGRRRRLRSGGRLRGGESVPADLRHSAAGQSACARVPPGGVRRRRGR
jgi:hypothetical protein